MLTISAHELLESWHKRGIVPRSSAVPTSSSSPFSSAYSTTSPDRTTHDSPNRLKLKRLMDSHKDDSQIGSNMERSTSPLVVPDVNPPEQNTNITEDILEDGVVWTSDFGEEPAASPPKKRRTVSFAAPARVTCDKIKSSGTTKRSISATPKKLKLSQSKFINPLEKYSKLAKFAASIPERTTTVDLTDEDENWNMNQQSEAHNQRAKKNRPAKGGSGYRKEDPVEVLEDSDEDLEAQSLFVRDEEFNPINDVTISTNHGGKGVNATSISDPTTIADLLRTLTPVIQELSDSQLVVNQELKTQLDAQHAEIKKLKEDNTIMQAQLKLVGKGYRQLEQWRHMMDSVEQDKLVAGGKMKPVAGGPYGGPPQFMVKADRVRLL